jgi:hypothetical protein
MFLLFFVGSNITFFFITVEIKKKQEKLGENLKKQLLVPGDFFTRRKAEKPGFSWTNQEVW